MLKSRDTCQIPFFYIKVIISYSPLKKLKSHKQFKKPESGMLILKYQWQNVSKSPLGIIFFKGDWYEEMAWNFHSTLFKHREENPPKFSKNIVFSFLQMEWPSANFFRYRVILESLVKLPEDEIMEALKFFIETSKYLIYHVFVKFFIR